MALVMNTQNLPYLTTIFSNGQGQEMQQVTQSYLLHNFSFLNPMMSGMHNAHLYVANNDCNAIQFSVSEQQSQIPKMYQMKQEQMRISHQRHMEEMNHVNSYPHIRHHCVIIDRLDKEDSRYTDFVKQVQNNERLFEVILDGFDDKHYVAQEMNSLRLSALGQTRHLLWDPSRELLARVDGKCGGNNCDEETTNHVNVNVNVNANANDGCAKSSSETNATGRPALTCLSLLEDWCGQISDNGSEDERNTSTQKDECDEESFVVDYALINAELEMMAKEKSTPQHVSVGVTPPIVPLPDQVQIPVSVNPPLPLPGNANYAIPMVTMPMMHFPYQTCVFPNVVVAAAFNVQCYEWNQPLCQ